MPTIDDLEEWRLKYILASTTNKTKSRYHFGIVAYKRFCKTYSLDPIVYEKDRLYIQLQQFTVWRLRFLGGTNGTAVSDINAIQKWLEIFGVTSRIRTDCKPFESIVNAAKKYHPSTSRTTRALVEWEIKLISASLKPTSVKAIVLRAVWAFGWVTAMRPNEYLAEKQNECKDRKRFYLRKERIFIWEPPKGSTRKHFGVVWFFRSKTNHSLRQEFAVLPCKCDINFCPITELQRLLSILKDSKPHTAIFSWPNGKFVTAAQSSRDLKRLAGKVGIDNKRVSAYSLKKACIVDELRKGLPDTVIVQCARWKSFQSMRAYIDLGPRELIEARMKYIKDREQQAKDHFRILVNAKY